MTANFNLIVVASIVGFFNCVANAAPEIDSDQDIFPEERPVLSRLLEEVGAEPVRDVFNEVPQERIDEERERRELFELGENGELLVRASSVDEVVAQPHIHVSGKWIEFKFSSPWWNARHSDTQKFVGLAASSEKVAGEVSGWSQRFDYRCQAHGTFDSQAFRVSRLSKCKRFQPAQ